MKNFNSIIGLGFIGLAFGLLYLQNKQAQQAAPQDDFVPPAVEQQIVEETDHEDTIIPVAADDEVFTTATETETVVEEPEETIPETDLTLHNDFISVDFTKKGGAIKEIRFLKTKRGGLDDFVFNQGSTITALQLSRKEVNGQTRLLNYDFQILRSDAHSVVFEYDTGRGVKFIRSYVLQPADSDVPYQIDHVTTIANESKENSIKIGSSQDTELLLTLGTALPVESDKRGDSQAFAFYDGKDDTFIKSTYFTGSKGAFGMGAKDPQSTYENKNLRIDWASVKNQFFVSVFTPKQPATSVYARKTDVKKFANDDRKVVGIVGEIGFKPGVIAPASELQISGTYYVGPKEFKRLAHLGENQDELMQFGFFGWVSKILLTMMYKIHDLVKNWGLSIILLTVIVKAVFWPLTSYSAQSSKKMQLLQEPMKELREKYSDNPERMQKETMGLFKKYGVNPLAGCLPMLIQFPIFLGLYWMLRTSSELRYEPFLWISDLSLPDTVAHITIPWVGSIPLNIMPLINGVVMFFQMQMMPMSPTADPAQQKIMRFFPLMFLFIMYGFSSGLVLYWTVQSFLSVVQTVLVYRKKENLQLVPINPAAAPKKRAGSRRTPPKKK